YEVPDRGLRGGGQLRRRAELVVEHVVVRDVRLALGPLAAEVDVQLHDADSVRLGHLGGEIRRGVGDDGYARHLRRSLQPAGSRRLARGCPTTTPSRSRTAWTSACGR